MDPHTYCTEALDGLRAAAGKRAGDPGDLRRWMLLDDLLGSRSPRMSSSPSSCGCGGRPRHHGAVRYRPLRGRSSATGGRGLNVPADLPRYRGPPAPTSLRGTS